MEHSPQVNNIKDLVESEDFEVLGRGSKPNTIKVYDKESAQEGEIDLNVYRKQAGLKEFNSPDTPLKSSGLVGLDDRLKLSMGNTKGKVDFLKSKAGIEDASFNKEGEIVIKKNGIWEKIEKDGLGSGNYASMARELVGDMADVAGFGLVMGGGLVGSPLGPKGMALGSMGGEGVRTALGQLVGTYSDVSLTEDGSTKVSLNAVKDMATEGAMVLVGDKLTRGALKVVGKVGEAGYNKVLRPTINKLGEKLNQMLPETRDAVAGLLKFATNATDGAASRLSRSPKGVMSRVDDVVAKVKTGADYERIISEVKEENANKLFSLIKDVPKHFNAKYGAGINKIISQIGDKADDFSVKMSGSFKDIMLKGGQIGDDAVEGLAQHPLFSQMIKQDKNGRFVTKKISEISGLDLSDAAMVTQAMPKLNKLLNIIQSTKSNSSELIGKNGFAQMKQIQGIMDELTYDVFGNNKSIQSMLKPMGLVFRNNLKNGVKNPKLRQSFDELQEFYSKNIALKSDAQKLTKTFNKKKIDSILDEIMAPETSKTLGTGKQIMRLAEEMGFKTKALADDIMDSEASLQFSRLSPHLRNLASGPGLLVSAAAGGAGFAAGGGDTGAGLVGLGVAGALLSPRLAGKAAARVISTADDALTGNSILGMERILRQTFSSGNIHQIEKFLPLIMGKFNAEMAKGISDKVIIEAEEVMSNEGIGEQAR